MSCWNWCCLWAGISILSIWAELLAWRFLSAWSAFHQRVCPWTLKYGYLYSSLKLAELSISCDGCALAGAVYFTHSALFSQCLFGVEAVPFPISCVLFLLRLFLQLSSLGERIPPSRGLIGSGFAYLRSWWNSSAFHSAASHFESKGAIPV